MIKYLLVINVATYFISSAKDLPGHLKPLGHHRPPEVVTEQINGDLHPREFWERFVKRGIPVFFPGATKNSRAYKFWTEKYLTQHFGNLTVKLEAREESSNRLPVGEFGLGKDTIKHFIKNYQKMDAYVISQIPQPLEEEIELPSCLRCGSFLQNIQETHLFFSAGGGKTLLHRDPFSSVHCVFNGTKEWLTFHPSQTPIIYQSQESEHEYGGYSEIDVDEVDMNMFPRIADVKFSKINMNKGDCLFMPGGFWHQVRSNGYMNTAVSIWFSNMSHFDSDDCPIEIPQPFPLSDVDVIWRYSGYGEFTQGNHDIYLIQRLLLSWADEQQRINLKTFTERFFHYDKSRSKRDLLKENTKHRAKEFIEFLDPAGSGFVSKEKVDKMSTGDLKRITLLYAPTDVSNTFDFEYSHISEQRIRELFKLCFKDESSQFDEKKFIQGYTKYLGGTLEKANEIVKRLLYDQKTGVYKKLVGRLDDALLKYRNALEHDPTMEHELYNHLTSHDEL